ncbi:MAG: hypothetical protein M4579_004277 [Chaenotheca gracillima]|nr:MAG: hypothetical protein M4579_004277 [Chaenotheca gracillima]
MSKHDGTGWDKLEWRRRLETFGDDDSPVIARGPKGEVDAVCNLGELTDEGRQTTLKLGQRLRHLYVDQLKYMPALISDADMIYLRATPIPRALESVQQSFWGMYPPSSRTLDFPPPTIVTRTPADETLFPNDGNCRRFSQLSRAFAQRTADRWNDTKDMDYLNKLISKWMPPHSSRLAVDSHPRLSGVMDTVNSTLAHGPETRLPKEFYNPKAREIIDKIACEEWFSGYKESREYRSLGIGALMGDIVSRMSGSIEENGKDGLLEIGGPDGKEGNGRGGERGIKFAMSGCHDTTLAGIIASLGAFEGDEFRWPPYTSHVAIELFKKDEAFGTTGSGQTTARPPIKLTSESARQKSLWSSLFGSFLTGSQSDAIGRRCVDEMNENERTVMNEYFVRLRFNDRPLSIPGCKPAGNHLEGDESFCTFEAFKRLVDDFTPRNWKQACASNLDHPAFPRSNQPAGVIPTQA